MVKKTISMGKKNTRRRKKDFGEELGGQPVSIRGAAPLRIIIGGPPHSGKSTLMHLLEDKFNEYGVPVELVDMDLSAPTDLRSKEGFTVTRDKRDWTPELAEEAAGMFMDSDSEIVLGDSVGLISSITEILSQPADVAILIASGNKGDDHEVYKQVIRKWKNFFTDVDTPLLVVVRSSLNPDDLSMFDPQDNYGVIVGLDRKAFEEGVINPQDACIEGMVFEIGQAFDLVFTSPMTEKHRAIIEAKWPSVKDIDTWTPENATNLSPEKRAFLSNLEKNYFEQKRRDKYQLGDEYRAEEFKGTTPSGHKVEYDDGSFYMDFAQPIDGYDSVGGSWYGGDSESPDDIDLEVMHTDESYDNFEISIHDVEVYGVSDNKRNRWYLDNDSRGNGPDIFVDMSDELVEAIEEGLNWMLEDFGSVWTKAETFNAYTTRFNRNKNTRDKIIGRGRRSIKSDPEYQTFQKYALGGLSILAASLLLIHTRKSSNKDA